MEQTHMNDVIEIGDYIVREQPFEELQRTLEIPFSLCGVNPYGYYRHIRRFIAERDGAVVGEGWTMASRFNLWGELGHYAMFGEEHKRKGLGGRILKLCIEALRDAGMETMFIDTGPGIAHMIYEKHGFRDVVPDHPEWMGLSYDGRSIQDYLEEYFVIEGEPLHVAPLDFSHLIEIRALLNASVDPAFLVKNYLMTLFADDQLHEGQILVELPALSDARRRIQMLGLFAGPKLIGFSTLAPWRLTQWDNRHEAHIGLWDLHLHPPLWSRDRCALLFEEIRSIASEMGLCRLRVMETPLGTVKTEILRSLGFDIGFVMPQAVLLGQGEQERGYFPKHRLEDLAVYETELGTPEGYAHPYRFRGTA